MRSMLQQYRFVIQTRGNAGDGRAYRAISCRISTTAMRAKLNM
jgi:hypothetical protein